MKNSFGIDISKPGIYQIVNTINGDRYIGSSVNIWVRWKYHTSTLRNNIHHNKYMQRAWNKYGENAFILKPLLICNKNKLSKYEQSCLDIMKPEYNISNDVIAPMRGINFSQEHKDKIAKANAGKQFRLGQKNTEEHRMKISKANIGKKLSEETRKKIGLSKLGNTYRRGSKLTDETKEKLRLSHLGYIPNDETRVKMSLSQKANPNNSGRFGYGNPGFLGHKHTDESKKKMSEAVKRHNAKKRGEYE